MGTDLFVQDISYLFTYITSIFLCRRMQTQHQHQMAWMPLLFLTRWRRTVHGQESISSADSDHMHFTAAVDQTLGELTSYWLPWKEYQCHRFLSSGLPQDFLLLSHDWCVRRTLCPSPHEYRCPIHLGWSCGCWWNLFWYHWSYSLTVSEKDAPVGWIFTLVWHASSHSRPRFSCRIFSHYWICTYVEHNVRPNELGSVCLYCGKYIKCDILFEYPWAPWWHGAHGGSMVCSVPSFAVQAVSYCVI